MSFSIYYLLHFRKKITSPIELDSFLYYNLDRVISYYNMFNREVDYEFKASSKRSLAK